MGSSGYKQTTNPPAGVALVAVVGGCRTIDFQVSLRAVGLEGEE